MKFVTKKLDSNGETLYKVTLSPFFVMIIYMMHLLKFFKEVKVELSHVVWPERSQVFKVALVIGITVAVLGLFFLLVDSVVYRLVRLFINA